MNDEAKQRKQKREIAIGNRFLKELQFDHTFIRHGDDDGEPDLIYRIMGRDVGFEIVAAYYHNDQAKMERQLAAGELKSVPGSFGIKLGVPNDQDKVITSQTQKELNKKCLKQYSGREVWLFVYLEAPLLEMHEFEELAAAIIIPRHNFARIYIGFLNHWAGAKLVVERRC